MAEPTIFPEGSTPTRIDTVWRLLEKIVGAAYNNATSPNPSNKPQRNDTRWQLEEKWARIQAGI